ncbi:MAG: DUF2769 domain-containing protein [Euryarchaeota archaeon]|nr:DUF2769 domain-containing protein [Euryarchaeota archaeon]
MDKFEEIFNQLMEMLEEEKKEKIEELEGDCVCPICPSYNQCAKDSDEKLFCIIGKSEPCITNERGCMCPTCPLAAKFGIGVKYNFYCTRGSEIEHRKM